jgi:hypothetical protein
VQIFPTLIRYNGSLVRVEHHRRIIDAARKAHNVYD